MMLRKLQREDAGLTLTELLVVSMVTAIVGAILLGMMGSLFNNVGFQFALGDTQAEVRPELRSMIVRIRQARPVGNTAADDPVSALSWDRLVIHVDTTPGATTAVEQELEKVEYILVPTIINEGTQLYQLERRTFEATNPTVRPLNYSAIASENVVLLEDVIASVAQPLFNGAFFDAAGVKQSVAACAGINCDFSLVELFLQVDPSLTTDNPRIYEIEEEVRLRNG